MCSQLHVGWEIRVWKDEDIGALNKFTNKDVFDVAQNYGM